MRYLYGDSVPFPPQYDFLAALEVFCMQAARVVRLDAETRTIRTAAEEGAHQRARMVEGLDAFHKEAVVALREGAKDSHLVPVREYVQQVTELAQRIVDEARRTALQTSDRDQQMVRGESERRRGEARDAIERMLVAVRLPVQETQIKMALEQGRNDMSAVFTHDGALVTSFTLSSDELENWRAPRHVRDFAQQVTMPVG